MLLVWWNFCIFLCIVGTNVTISIYYLWKLLSQYNRKESNYVNEYVEHINEALESQYTSFQEQLDRALAGDGSDGFNDDLDRMITETRDLLLNNGLHEL